MTPMFFAFDNKGFEEGKQKLGLTDNSEVLALGCGSYIRKTDRELWKNLYKQQDIELKEVMNEYSFAFDAFSYELSNHEYCVTYDTEDTLDALGLTYEEVEGNPVLNRALKAACKYNLNWADKNNMGW